MARTDHWRLARLLAADSSNVPVQPRHSRHLARFFSVVWWSSTNCRFSPGSLAAAEPALKQSCWPRHRSWESLRDACGEV